MSIFRKSSPPRQPKPFGFVAYYPGPGLGRTLYPHRPVLPDLESARIRREHPLHRVGRRSELPHADYVISKVGLALNEHKPFHQRQQKSWFGCTAYKEKCGRHCAKSPSVEVMDRLHKLGANISYSDPHVPEFPYIPGHHYFDLKSEPLTPETVAKYDCVVLTTDHDRFDYDMICRTRQTDCRYARQSSREKPESRESVIPLTIEGGLPADGFRQAVGFLRPFVFRRPKKALIYMMLLRFQVV